MGSNEYDDEKPTYPVRVRSFYLGKFQVTQQVWLALEKENPSTYKGENRPIENVSWYIIKEFISKLTNTTGRPFQLPTEAEWEYAARGSIYSQGYTYAGSDKLEQVGWYDENSGKETHDVGLLLSNELGLYDMSGNVWEWCEDDWHENFQGAPKDGAAWVNEPNRGGGRVIRGGGLFSNAHNCRTVGRYRDAPDLGSEAIGFRLCLHLHLT